jgi:NAD+ synthase (glutamine-hydrolysing)
MKSSSLQVLMAQLNPTVGALNTNTQEMIDIIKQYDDEMDLIIFPELAICGYPPEDLLLHQEFVEEIAACLEKIRVSCQKATVIVGLARKHQEQIFNSAALIQNQTIQFYDKQSLPNYGVFDEHRYFSTGNGTPCIFEIKGMRFAILICEDIWVHQTVKKLSSLNLDTLIIINASPYETDKIKKRLETLKSNQIQGAHQLYVNLVGGQDELLFDGQSMAINKDGVLKAKGPAFEKYLLKLRIDTNDIDGSIYESRPPIEELYKALCLGLKDFGQKNGFKKIVLGLSGGIDSALTLAIAVDAFGKDHVHALLMPSQHTDPIGVEDAIEEARLLGVGYNIIPISPLFKEYAHTLNEIFDPNALCLQNLQARIRGMLLMAYANQHHALVLTTSNKSETAVGYATLYGDMCGGFAVLKDIYKTKIYELAQYRNLNGIVIPERVIQRAPSAELAPNQKDQDDLPPYDLLDEVLFLMIEKRAHPEEIIAKGYAKEMVEKIYSKLQSSEFKRVQAAPGLKVTSVNFGKDWRYPITNHTKYKK